MDFEGLLYICKVENVADPGRMPDEKLVKVSEAFYRKRTVGYNRIYAAMGANQRIDMLVRCANTDAPEEGKEYFAVFPDDNMAQYRIEIMQEIAQDHALDLTLVRLEDLYDIYAE